MTFAYMTTIKDDVVIEKFLESFFEVENDVLTEKNVQGIKKLASYYDSPKDNIYYDFWS